MAKPTMAGDTRKPRVDLLKKYGKNTIAKYKSSQPRSADVYKRFDKAGVLITSLPGEGNIGSTSEAQSSQSKPPSTVSTALTTNWKSASDDNNSHPVIDTPNILRITSSQSTASNPFASYAPAFGRLLSSVAGWARIRKSESKMIVEETKSFVGRNFDGYGRKEIMQRVVLRDGRIEDRCIRRSSRNDANLLLTER